MNFEESAKKLYTLPWQALYDLAVEKQIDGEEIKHKEKTEIIRRVLLSDITEAEIEAVIDDYTYGNRVTFTLWGFSKTLSVEDISALKALEQTEEDYIDVEGFRNLKYVSLKTCSDRLEMIYSYSKEYSFINEEGKADSVWEMHQGCLWIGTEKNYLASISNECESYELPYCAHCGEALTYNRKGVLECSCDAPLRVTCAEQHRSCEIKPWFLPKDRLVNAINKNILNVYKDHNLDYKMCIMGDELYIVHEKTGSTTLVIIIKYGSIYITCTFSFIAINLQISSSSIKSTFLPAKRASILSVPFSPWSKYCGAITAIA